MAASKKESHQEKEKIALVSVIAAVFITCFKLVVGLLTGSLGIISEALHSGLDLASAILTFFSVRISDKPADRDHNFGHGKVENLSAFVQTLLLLATCVWIIYKAIYRLASGKLNIEVNSWSYLVIITSIVIDYTRSKALYRAAKEHNSQVLEANALHFSTDIWSSAVVLLGLTCANFGYYFADSVAALIVAFIVLGVSCKLIKSSADVLLDRTPFTTLEKVNSLLKGIPEITRYHDVKIRTAGPDTFIEVNIHVQPKLTIEESHAISHKVEKKICSIIERCEVHVHAEPEK